MQIEIKVEDGTSIATISGEIDGRTAPQVQDELLPVIGEHGKLVLELSGVTYMSSAGLRVLLLMYRQATAKDGKVVLVGLSDEIRDVMSMTGFLNFFVVADSLAEGLAALS
jgi:anti-sigma B factor antagonist